VCAFDLPDGTRVAAKTGSRDALDVEAWALGRCRDLGIPVPRVLSLDTSGDEDVLVVSWEPGVSAGDLPDDLLGLAARQAGEMLRVVHGVRLEGFGWIDHEERPAGEIHGQDASWQESIAREMAWATDHLERRGLLHAPESALLRSAYDERRDALASVRVGSMLHGDLSINHILADPRTGEVTSIIDWSDLQSGDPVWDLAVHGTRRHGTWDTFLAGYGDADLTLVPFYRCVRAAWVARWIDERGWDTNAYRKGVLRRHLAALA
jgi:aminoglycoside phosphotransferase (APT) family kinase protein